MLPSAALPVTGFRVERSVINKLTALANSLTGNSAANLLDGGTGADTLAGGAGTVGLAAAGAAIPGGCRNFPNAFRSSHVTEAARSARAELSQRDNFHHVNRLTSRPRRPSFPPSGRGATTSRR